MADDTFSLRRVWTYTSSHRAAALLTVTRPARTPDVPERTSSARLTAAG
jgi:hypothetical protein